MKTAAYLFNDAIVDRHARLANSLDVQPADEFAERIAHLPQDGKALVPSFMDRTRQFRRVFGEAS